MDFFPLILAAEEILEGYLLIWKGIHTAAIGESNRIFEDSM